MTPSNRSSEPKWEMILRTRLNGVVLWNQERNALRLAAAEDRYSDDSGDDDGLEVISSTEPDPETPTPTASVCPLCLQQLPGSGGARRGAEGGNRPPRSNARRLPSRHDTSYFSLLSEANSRTQSPRTTARSDDSVGTETQAPLAASSLNSGYYRCDTGPQRRGKVLTACCSRFFVELDKLGKGGSGTVHLVRHVLNGENLGLYACKRSELSPSYVL